MTLNGWQRLWLLLCGLYLIAVLVGGVLTFPDPTKIAHEDVFEEQLKPESCMKLAMPDPLGLLWESEVGLRVTMPNGHVLQFKKGMTEKDALSVAQDYDSLLHKQASNRRVVHVLFMFVCWVVPLIALYIFGWAVGWGTQGIHEISILTSGSAGLPILGAPGELSVMPH